MIFKHPCCDAKKIETTQFEKFFVVSYITNPECIKLIVMNSFNILDSLTEILLKIQTDLPYL